MVILEEGWPSLSYFDCWVWGLSANSNYIKNYDEFVLVQQFYFPRELISGPGL